MSKKRVSTRPVVPWTDNDYTINKDMIVWGPLLGKGNFSKVFKATIMGEEVAVKKHITSDPSMEKYLMGELAILKRCHHHGLVDFMGACKIDEKTTYIVTEYIAGGDLRMLLQAFPKIGWKIRVKILKDVAGSLNYMHERNLLHRDIKTENIMLDLNLNPKLIDLGFAREIAVDKHMTMCGTDEFMAPEVIFGMEYDQSSDIYSFGICIAEVCTRKAPGSEVSFLDRTPMNGFCVDWDEMEEELSKVNTPKSLKMLIKETAADEAEDRVPTVAVYEWLEELDRDLKDDASNVSISEDKILKLVKKKWDHIMKNGERADSTLNLDPDDLTTGFFDEAQQPQSEEKKKEMEFKRRSVRRAMKATAADMQGFLYKRSGWRSWKKYWFKMTDETGLIYWADKPKDQKTKPKGVLFFTDMLPPKNKADVAFVSNAMSRKPNSFMIMKNDKKVIFAGMSIEETRNWVTRINRGYINFKRQNQHMF